MIRINLFYFGIFILITMFSCNLITNVANFESNQFSYDTIHFENINDTNNTCKSLEDSFYKRFGIIISNYYIIMDSLAIDLNQDSYVDTIAILSPIPLEPITEDYNCNFENQPKRLLVEVLNYNGKSKIRSVYNNLLSDVGGVLSHYNGIFRTNNGFKIVHQSGAKYSWKYTNEYSVAVKNKLSLIKISKTCSYEGLEKIIDYTFKNQTLESINISDTLQLQCNCDKYWLELEKK